MDFDDETASRPRQVLPQVPRLRGRGDLEVWDIAITGKLAVDGAAIGDARAQLFYIWGAMDPDLQKSHFLPWMQKTLSLSRSVAANTPQAFLQYIREVLEEPNKGWRAGQRLTKLCQRSSQAVSEYLPLFEGALFQAGGDEWPDRAKILLLTAGLNADTKQRLDQETWPDQWAPFKLLLRRFETSFVSAPLATTSRSRASTFLSDVEDPMDISVNAIATPAQRRRWRKEGRCLKCGYAGHFAGECAGTSTQMAVVSARAPPDKRELRYQAARAYRDAWGRVEELDAFNELDELDDAEEDDP